jgi:diguanylate cyclase (GGDEF)-like protein
MTVSIGLAALDDYEEGFDALLKRADDALYQAKDRGRNCVQLG